IAGWSSLVARRAHNPEVAGSNPAPAIPRTRSGTLSTERSRHADVESAHAISVACPREKRRGGNRLSADRREPRGRSVSVERPYRLRHAPVRVADAGRFVVASRPTAGCDPRVHGQVAQLVEHTTETRGVGGSIPSLATV